MNSFSKTLYLCLILIAPATALASAEVRIKHSTENMIEFDLTIDAQSLEILVNDDSSISLVDNLLIGIPFGSKVFLEKVSTLKSSLFENKKGIDLAKIKRSANIVEISNPITLRGKQFVALRLSPMTGSMDSRNNMIVEKINIRLSFEGGQTTGSSSAVVSSDKFFDKIFQSAIINYDQFKNYPPKKIGTSLALSSNFAVAAHPFSVTENWFKISVSASGLYSVTGSELSKAGLNLNNISSSDLHLFNGSGLQLPIDNLTARPQLTEIAIIMDDGGDGSFEASDKFIFYGESTDRWLHNPIDTFINNPYESNNIYWLAVSPFFNLNGLRMQPATLFSAPDTTITSYKKLVHVEQDNQLQKWKDGRIEDYYNWFWTEENSFEIFVSTPDRIIGTTADIFLAGRTYSSGGQNGYIDLTVNGAAGFNKFCNSNGCDYQSNSLADGLNSFLMTMNDHPIIPAYFDYVNVAYSSFLRPDNGSLYLNLGSHPGAGIVELIDEFSLLPLVLDISNPLQPETIGGVLAVNGKLSFQAELDSFVTTTFYVSANIKALTANSIESKIITDLRDNLSQTDLLVIAPEIFSSALGEYISFRSSEGYSIRLVSLEDITDNFSHGLYDPAAIRDFLIFAYENFVAPSPTYALFVGDGTFDFMNILGTNQPNYIPPFIHPFDFEEFYSDDNYLYFGSYGILDADSSYDTSSVSLNRGYEMISARWPVQSTAEIAIITQKIKNYEDKSNLGNWRTNVTLIADDEFTTSSYNESIHTIQSEELEKSFLPNLFNRDKIYLWEYPFVNRKKPEVNNAIVKAINDGTLLVNYVGHGNPDLWAHEHVFTRNDDLPRLQNQNMLPLVFTASCEIAFFDNPQREGMAEDLLAMPNGGAIGVISATRTVYSSPNAAFNKEVFAHLMYDRSLTISEAMFIAKLKRQYTSGTPRPLGNDQAYIYFGDPLLKLGIPQMDISFSQKPDSLIALTEAAVSGQILNPDSSLFIGDGRFFATVFDSEREKRHYILDPNGNPLSFVDYNVTGPLIFRGSGLISSGEFEFKFIPPLDIGFGGKGAKISVYAILDDKDAFGLVDSISVSGTIANSTDSSGPVITYQIGSNQNFLSGDYVNANEILSLQIFDSSGINLSGGLGHGISLEIDDKSESIINLTDLFEYDSDSYFKGSINYQLAELSSGSHSLKIKAWDNANNSSVIQFDLEVVTSGKIEIAGLLNYPNPMKDSTLFSYSLSQPTEKFSIEIFSLSGRKIKTFEINNFQPAGYYQDVIWYGDDFAYERVATGVYIYKAVAYSAVTGEMAESYGKIILIN